MTEDDGSLVLFLRSLRAVEIQATDYKCASLKAKQKQNKSVFTQWGFVQGHYAEHVLEKMMPDMGKAVK